ARAAGQDDEVWQAGGGVGLGEPLVLEHVEDAVVRAAGVGAVLDEDAVAAAGQVEVSFVADAAVGGDGGDGVVRVDPDPRPVLDVGDLGEVLHLAVGVVHLDARLVHLRPDGDGAAREGGDVQGGLGGQGRVVGLVRGQAEAVRPRVAVVVGADVDGLVLVR